MAQVKVIAHFMHDSEKKAAEARIRDAVVTDSFVMGLVDAADVASLKEDGLIVQEMRRPPELRKAAPAKDAHPGTPPVPEPADGEPKPVGRPLASGGARGRAAIMAEGEADFDVPLGREPDEVVCAEPPGVAAAAEPSPPASEPAYYVVSLAGPLLQPWRDQLDALGVDLIERVAPAAYVARLQPTAVRSVEELDFVPSISAYEAPPSDMVFAASGRAAPPLETGGVAPAQQPLPFDIELNAPDDRAKVVEWLEAHGQTIAGAGGRRVRIYALPDAPVLCDVSGVSGVARVTPYDLPRLWNDHGRRLLGVDGDDAGRPGVGLTGAGQIVAVADTGIDQSHPDFAGRLAGVIALGRKDDVSDPDGHGTHVAGTVAGTGAASGGVLKGVAPGAQLYVQSLLDTRGNLGGLPTDLGQLFQNAYDAQARIHNDSWGSETTSFYTMDAEDIDRFVWEHPDMLIVMAAGNTGRSVPRRLSPPGLPDWLSVVAPGTCKNALTVGASRSDRIDGARSRFDWHQTWPDRFSGPPLETQKISGDGECLAGFSGRGPCADRRIKPDLVAPGTDIASTRSSQAPLRDYWGPYPGFGDSYAFMGGTSMAAPFVSGCAALVREYFVDTRQHVPSAALLKATLIAGARWLSGDDAVGGQSPAPNYNQGFGAAYLPSTVPSPADSALRLEFIDDWEGVDHRFTRIGRRFRFKVQVATGVRFRVCMAYTDAPASGLQNNLDLFVETPDGSKLVGNEHEPQRLTEYDTGNNVELVAVDDPAPGSYMVQVSCSNLLSKEQGFALVVTGALASDLVEV